MPHLKKAELIEGVVYMPAALRFRRHAEPHGDLMGWLWTYKVMTPNVHLGDNPIDWFSLQDGNYVSLPAELDGAIKSRVFPGLWLAIEPLLPGDTKAVLDKLQNGLSSAEHAAFVEQLTG